MKSYAAKYVELAEKRGKEMAKRWLADVKKNERTQFYNSLSDDKILPLAEAFYLNFSKMFVSEKPEKSSMNFFLKYAEACYQLGIPLDEAIYALFMMRRQIWLYAEFQNIFMTSIDQRQAVETLSRTILMFDYASYEISKRYQELIKKEIGKKLIG